MMENSGDSDLVDCELDASTGESCASCSLNDAASYNNQQCQIGQQGNANGADVVMRGTKSKARVCNICGDAGHKDLLGICCRCSVGAEHIYCMREMLEKVPEGDWICDECQYEEEIKKQRQHRVVTLL